jgi:signal transduction histidine kinase
MVDATCCHLHRCTKGKVELAFATAGIDHWSIRVSDTGVGIATSGAHRVFEEFERAAGDDVPGTGLGLAIVKDLCRVLHGHIRFESRESHRTTFEIQFALEPEHAAPSVIEG